jgi:hypothetical protein
MPWSRTLELAVAGDVDETRERECDVMADVMSWAAPLPHLSLALVVITNDVPCASMRRGILTPSIAVRGEAIAKPDTAPPVWLEPAAAGYMCGHRDGYQAWLEPDPPEADAHWPEARTLNPNSAQIAKHPLP